jgi:hypothetical protein
VSFFVLFVHVVFRVDTRTISREVTPGHARGLVFRGVEVVGGLEKKGDHPGDDQRSQ